MRSIVFVLSIVLPLMFFSTVVTAEETKKACGITNSENSEIRRVFDFMKKYIDGKTFYTHEKSYKIDGGKMEALYSEEEIVTNLQMQKEQLSGGREKEGMTYDITNKISHKAYELGKDGKKIMDAEKDYSRTQTNRCYVIEMYSTGGLLGYCQTLRDDGSIKITSPPSGFVMKIEGNRLIKNSDQLFYKDKISSNYECGSKPGASMDVTEYYMLPNGKMEIKVTNTSYDVDPSTMKRTALEGNYETIILNEK